MKGWMGVLCAGAAAMAVAAPPSRPPIEGRVVRVVDGDTVWVEREAAAPLVVRLQGIDAPESCQAHGPEARQALEELVLHQPVQVIGVARDRHGRTVARLMKGTLDVGDRLVRDGHAWSQRWRHDKGPYVAEERMAHALRRGLHVDPAALLPREFRQRHGECFSPAPAGATPSGG